MIKELLQTVKRSKNLQGLHLCDNPGCYDQTLFYYALEVLQPINFSNWADPPKLKGKKKDKISLNEVMPLYESDEDFKPPGSGHGTRPVRNQLRSRGGVSRSKHLKSSSD